MAKVFQLQDILSVTTGVLFAPMTSVYQLTGYLISDENVTTLGLLAVHDKCKESLLRQLPKLADIDVSHVNRENYSAELAKLIKKFGKALIVKSIEEELGEKLEPRSVEDDIVFALSINQNIEPTIIVA